MPIAGCGDYSTKKIAQAVKSLPIWVFYGEKDAPGCARTLVAAIRAAGDPNVQYTEYPGVAHDSFDIAYEDPKVIEWLLAQKR
jgi:predicted peptidase